MISPFFAYGPSYWLSTEDHFLEEIVITKNKDAQPAKALIYPTLYSYLSNIFYTYSSVEATCMYFVSILFQTLICSINTSTSSQRDHYLCQIPSDIDTQCGTI